MDLWFQICSSTPSGIFFSWSLFLHLVDSASLSGLSYHIYFCLAEKYFSRRDFVRCLLVLVCWVKPFVSLDSRSWFCGQRNNHKRSARTASQPSVPSKHFQSKSLHAHLFSLQNLADCVDGWRAQIVKCSLICLPSLACHPPTATLPGVFPSTLCWQDSFIFISFYSK